MDKKNLSVRVSPELHKKLKFKLLEEDKSFQEWAENKIKEYVEKD